MKKFFKKNQSDGQGMVEFALVIPILLLVIFGLIEAGRLLFITIAINSSSREAARYGASVGELGQERYKDCAGIREAARRLGSLAGVGDADITIAYDKGPGTSPVSTDCPPAGVDVGDRIVVDINTQYTPLVPIVNIPPFPIRSSTGRTILTKVPVGDAVIPPAIPPNVYFKVSPAPAGDEGTIIQVVVELNNITNQNVVVNFQVTGGTADEGVDYNIQASSTGASEYEISIPPGSLSAAILIDAVIDDVSDDGETVTLAINSPPKTVNANPIAPTTVTATIYDPVPPEVSFTSNTQPDVEEGVGSATINVVLSKSSTSNIQVPIAFSSCSLDCTPYTIAPSPILFSAGETEKTVTITWVDDNVVEEDENLELLLGAPVDDSYALGSPSTHSFTVLDDDTPTVQFASAESSVDEIDGETIAVVVSLDPCDPLSSTTVDFTVTSAGTAEPEDYTISPSSPITFSAANPCVPETINIIVTIEGDDVAEGDETIVLAITGVSSNAEIGSQDTHTVTIVDDETALVDIITPDETTIEGDQETKVVDLQLSIVSESDVSVPFSVSGTATEGAGDDYTITSSPVVFSPGETSKTIEISVIDDPADEITETVKVSLGNPVNAEKGSDTEYQLEIIDDDGTGADPDIVVTKDDFQDVDTDGTGTITVGDILEYQISIVNNGGPASDVVFTDSPDVDTNIIEGSVTTSRGTITSGNAPGDTVVTVDIGSLGGGESVTISFKVEIENTMAPGDAIVSNQGFVSTSEIASVPSDDPVTAAEQDPTQTEVTRCPVGLPPTIIGGKVSWPIQNPVVGQVHTLTRISIQWSNLGLKSIAFAGWTHSPSGGTADPIFYQVDSINDASIPLSITFSPTTLNMVFTFNGNQLPGLINLQADFNGCQTISPPGY